MQHVHRAYDELQNLELKLHLKASTISVKGIFSELADMKKSHTSLQNKFDAFMINPLTSAELISVKKAIKVVVQSQQSMDTRFSSLEDKVS